MLLLCFSIIMPMHLRIDWIFVTYYKKIYFHAAEKHLNRFALPYRTQKGQILKKICNLDRFYINFSYFLTKTKFLPRLDFVITDALLNNREHKTCIFFYTLKMLSISQWVNCIDFDNLRINKIK